MNHEAEFEKRWNRWPEDRRTLRYSCERRWAMLMMDAPDPVALMAEIDAGIDRWLDSQKCADGFIISFFNLLDPDERRWQERPKRRRDLPAQHVQPVEAIDAPPLECGCGEPGCAICRLLARAS